MNNMNNMNKMNFDISKYSCQELMEIFNLKEITHEYLKYHLRGISSYKGLSFIESKLSDY